MKGIKHREVLSLLAVVALALLALGTAPANARGVAAGDEHHIKAELVPVGGSGVHGFVNLVQRPHEGGTHIEVVARGLQPGGQYVSLYYDNNTCTLPGDVLGSYTANRGGVGTTKGNIDDNLDEVDSVSVRVAGTLELLACANVHP